MLHAFCNIATWIFKKNLYEMCKLCSGWPASGETALFENLTYCISVKCHSGSNPSNFSVRHTSRNLINRLIFQASALQLANL
jgi:hypothetical protein